MHLKSRCLSQDYKPSQVPPPSKTSPSALFLPPHWAPATPIVPLLLKHAKVVPTARPLNSAWISLPQNLIELVIQAGVLCAGGKSLLNRPAMLFSRRAAARAGSGAASLRLPPFPPRSQEKQEDLEGTCQWCLPVFSEKQKLPQDTPFTATTLAPPRHLLSPSWPELCTWLPLEW